MQAVPVYPQNGCSHPQTTVGIVKEGEYFHTIPFLVLWCVDCGKILDRKKMTRGRES